jgi:uracil-DNA glycosylase
VTGDFAHETFVVARGTQRSAYPCVEGHGRVHPVGALKLFDSHHYSRYNTNTGALTPQLFRDAFARLRECLDATGQ